MKLENLKFLEIINKRSEYPSVMVVVCVVGSVTGGVGAASGTTSRRCFGRLDQARTHQGRVGNGQDGESERADWVGSLRYPAEIDLVVDVTRRSLIKLK